MYIKINMCKGGTNQLPHRLVSAEPTRDNFFILSPQAYAECNGDILTYLKNRINPLSPIRKSRGLCNKTTCEGKREYREVTVSLPVILVFEFMPQSPAEGQINNTEEKQADQTEGTKDKGARPAQVERKPWTLRQYMSIPGEKADGRESTEYYNIVGRMYYDEHKKHFFAHVRHGIDHCLLYDDSAQGIIQNMTQKNPVKTFLSGAGFTKDKVSTSYVVYHLRHGRAAQERISRRIWKDLKTKNNVLLTQSNVNEFPCISLTAVGETTRQSESTNAREIFVESEIHPSPVLQNGAKDVTLPKPVGKLWPFPPVETDDAETDIISVHPDAVQEEGSTETVKIRKKLSKRQSMSSSIDKSADTVNFFRCRCGFEGEVVDSDLDENVICCDSLGMDECNRWSHVACQPDGWTAFLPPEGYFYCPVCEEEPGQG